MKTNNGRGESLCRLPTANTQDCAVVVSSDENVSGEKVIPSISTVLPDPLILPKTLVRVGQRGRTWDLPRRFSAYEIVSQEQLSVRGAAPKFILRSRTDSNDWYIVKSAEKWGSVETLSELLNNLLGNRLSFPMAHAGILRADGTLCFTSKNFQRAGETLIHGSLLLEETFDDNLDGVGKKMWDEQRTYDLELIAEMLHTRCGDKGAGLFSKLLEMIVFDALIGSMDRHLQNWGLLATVTEPQTYRFAPIFDSARALLWNCDENKLQMLESNEKAFEAYISRARPIMGCASTGKAVNHFELVEHMAIGHQKAICNALELIHPVRVRKAAREILSVFPFNTGFTPMRRATITKVLMLRAEKLHQIL